MTLEIKGIGKITADKSTMNSIMVTLIEAKDFCDVMRVESERNNDRISTKAFAHRVSEYSENIDTIYNALCDKDFYKGV